MTKRSFEDLLTVGMELARAEAWFQWEWGELLAQVSDESLKAYAEAVGQEYETLKRYRIEFAQARLKF